MRRCRARRSNTGNDLLPQLRQCGLAADADQESALRCPAYWAPARRKCLVRSSTAGYLLYCLSCRRVLHTDERTPSACDPFEVLIMQHCCGGEERKTVAGQRCSTQLIVLSVRRLSAMTACSKCSGRV